MLRLLTAGESHGQALAGIIEGLPAGLDIDARYINRQLARRQQGYGRGARMKIEQDEVKIISGVRGGKTLGSPVTIIIENLNYPEWEEIMAPESIRTDRVVERPRPGHADLAGGMKYGHADLRNVLERASARETAVRVALGAVCRKFLEKFGIQIYSQVVSIGSVVAAPVPVEGENIERLMAQVDGSPVRCFEDEKTREMIQEIDRARAAGESLGGSFEVGALGIPPGLGSYAQWDRRLDSRLAAGLMSIPAIKAVEIGEGLAGAGTPGSGVHDEIFYDTDMGLERGTNRAGGIEGGVSNGETVWARAYMKPIPTLMRPLASVNISTWQAERAQVERSDVCAVPAAAVVGEAVMAWMMAEAFLEKFSGDNLEQVKLNYTGYMQYLRKVWKWIRTSS
ncbi:MAG: chorismate synthase [Syntrophomonadaceae bacterium]|nr:chorismate synthase [Syntrophomonadaceae bacterium]